MVRIAYGFRLFFVYLLLRLQVLCGFGIIFKTNCADVPTYLVYNFCIYQNYCVQNQMKSTAASCTYDYIFVNVFRKHRLLLIIPRTDYKLKQFRNLNYSYVYFRHLKKLKRKNNITQIMYKMGSKKVV